MADFGESFELCKIFQKGSLLGIRKHSDGNHVILTFKDRGVQVYNLDDQKLVNSWSVERHQDVTCSAIQDPTTKNFVTVFKKTELCVWTSSSSNLQHSKKFPLVKPVQYICVNMEANLEPAVVFEDGSVAKLSECTQFNSGQPKNKKPSKKIKTTVESNSLLWCSMCRQNNKTFVVLLYCEASKHHRLDILSLEKEEGERLLASCRLLPPEEDVKIVACTVGKTRPDLVTFWSDGSLCISDLCSVLPGCDNEGNTSHQVVSCRILQKLSSLASSRNKGCVSIATVDSSNVCVCGSSLINKNQEDTVTIWSTKYGTLQAKQSINKLRDVSSSSAILRQSPGVEHVCCTAGYICVGVPYGVGVCPVSVKGSSLANSLGRLSAPSQFSSERNLKPSLLVTPKLAKPGQELREWCATINSKDSAEESVLNKLTTPKKTPSLQLFSSELQHYINVKTAKEKVDSHENAAESGNKSVEKPTKCLFSQHFVTSVLRRCLTENQFWPRDSLDLLIQTKCIPASESTELLRVLIDKNEMELIVKCFQNINGIPETAIVSCLQYVLSFDGEQVSEDDSGSQLMELDIDGDILSYKQCPVAPARAQDLCTILSYPVNDVFMQDSLRQLLFQNALCLLKFLHYLMTHNSKLLATNLKKGDVKLNYAQVLDWASLLLNAHYTQLVLMPEAHEMLVSFHQVVEEQVQVYSTIQKLEGFLAQYKEHQPLPKKECVGLYTVEMLEL